MGTNRSKSGKKCCKSSCLKIDGCKLNYLATTTANLFAQKFTCEELDVLAVFFDVLADSLATFSAVGAINCPDGNSDEEIIVSGNT